MKSLIVFTTVFRDAGSINSTADKYPALLTAEYLLGRRIFISLRKCALKYAPPVVNHYCIKKIFTDRLRLLGVNKRNDRLNKSPFFTASMKRRHNINCHSMYRLPRKYPAPNE